MKTLLGIASVVTALLLVTVVTAENSSIEWKSIADAMTEAPKTDKKIVLDVYTDWCGWCKRMDKSTYSDDEVTSYISKKYIASKMNPEKEGKVTFQGKEYSHREFAQALGVRGYPATAFFNEKGELLTVVAGYIQTEEFKKILTYFGDDIYKTTSWEDYSKSTK